MRKFIIPERQLAVIILSASEASLDEGRSFTQYELSMALEFISKMPGVLTINTPNENKEDQVNGN